MAAITIPGASGAVTITVTGAQTLAFAQSFAVMVHNASTFVDLSTGATSTISGSGQTLYEVGAGQHERFHSGRLRQHQRRAGDR